MSFYVKRRKAEIDNRKFLVFVNKACKRIIYLTNSLSLVFFVNFSELQMKKNSDCSFELTSRSIVIIAGEKISAFQVCLGPRRTTNTVPRL